MNKVILSGNLTRDPEIRHTQSGKSVARMAIAVNRAYSKNSDGQNNVDFFNLTAWDKTAEFCGRYLKKGSNVIVEGRLQNDNYEDKNGVKHYSVNINVDNIEFGGSKRQNNNDDDNAPPFDDDIDVPF